MSNDAPLNSVLKQPKGGISGNVLTVLVHPGSRSFGHAVIDRFDAGLRDAGHANEIVDPIIQTMIVDKRAYDAGLREPMRMGIDEFTRGFPTSQ